MRRERSSVSDSLRVLLWRSPNWVMSCLSILMRSCLAAL